jgi:predicted O-linked N-acetylglucosamine transferase (SPINDLY family)
MSSHDSPVGSPSTELHEACGKAMEFQLAGQFDHAEQLYRAVLRAQPMHAMANHCIGMLKVHLQQPAESLEFLRVALNVNPEIPEYWLGYLEALLFTGQIDDATDTLALGCQYGLSGAATEEFAQRLATRRSQLAAQELSTLSSTSKPAKPPKARRAQRRREARLTREQDDVLLTLIGQRKFAEALVHARAMTDRFPEHGLGWKILGALLGADARTDEAVAAMQTSTRLMPDDAEAHCNLGTTLTKLNRYREAEACHKRALEIDPAFATAHYRLGMTYEQQGRYPEAEASLRTGIALKTDYAQGEDTHHYSNLLFILSHSASIDADSLFAEHCRFGENLESLLRASWPRHLNSKDPDRCLRIGFVSGDLRNHAIATFMEPLLEQMSRHSGFELHAYCNNVLEDNITLRLREYFNHWHSVSTLSDVELTKTIVDDRIDILIDLSGHTALNRLGTFARKPAPLQVSWLGYPGTTGLKAVDYYLADRHFLPPGEFDRHFTEKLVYLHALAPYQPHASAPPVNDLPALATGSLRFGSFNRLGKVNEASIHLWSQLLRALPSATMLLGGVALDERHNPLIDKFLAHGIASDRLTFHPRCGMDQYLALHHQVDLCLDTTPYTGGTTTCHALWMGVPTLTLAGATPAGRQSAANQQLVGLEGFTAKSPSEFVERGVYWSAHLVALAEVRAGLRARWQQAPSHQPAVSAEAFECALRQMWRRWCAGLPALSFEINESRIGKLRKPSSTTNL